MIQKHCKNHVVESTTKCVTTCYQPYASTTIDISQHSSDTNNISVLDSMDNNMDLDGMYLLVTFTQIY